VPLSSSRDYLSIGEVLDALRKEFDDVSISKIRFLEAEGLISPERTGSGYRKFYAPDVARLRQILTLQRDHFMPLKVIRDRLAGMDGAGDGTLAAEPEPSPDAQSNGAPAVELDRAGLLAESGLSDDQLSGLEDFGLIKEPGRYDENDVVIAKAARRFLDHGVEPRHLRMYRQFVDREAALFEQIVSPVAHKQDPEASREVSRSVKELVSLSRQMHDGALRASLSDLL
jgi:DNA-binding transcriptional MerR regulator